MSSWHSLYHSSLVTVDNVIQSKMFSGTMRSNNSKILPYYIKATQITNLKDITISTIVTSDRLPVLSRLASHYKGMLYNSHFNHLLIFNI